MKKKDIQHPKLYFDFKHTNNGIELFYYANQLDMNGKRIIQSSLKLHLNSFSQEELYMLNQKQYSKLLIYISRQEKVMNSYLNKGLNNQYEIVKESLTLMYNFKNDFKILMANHCES